MTNLQKTAENPTLHWRISLDNLEEGLDEIGKFPYKVSERTFSLPTMFIKGEKSKYINRKNTDLIGGFFPKSKLEVVQGAGHWGKSSPSLDDLIRSLTASSVHSEKPQEFQQLVIDFCNA